MKLTVAKAEENTVVNIRSVDYLCVASAVQNCADMFGQWAAASGQQHGVARTGLSMGDLNVIVIM